MLTLTYASGYTGTLHATSCSYFITTRLLISHTSRNNPITICDSFFLFSVHHHTRISWRRAQSILFLFKKSHLHHDLEEVSFDASSKINWKAFSGCTTLAQGFGVGNHSTKALGLADTPQAGQF
jgi:hypothetical protein